MPDEKRSTRRDKAGKENDQQDKDEQPVEEPEETLQPMVEEGGVLPIQFETFFRGVTTKQQKEKTLYEDKARFRTLFNQAAIGLGRVNIRDGTWIEVNDALCDMLGYKYEVLLTIPWMEITHPEDLDNELVYFKQMAHGEIDSFSLDKRFRHADGHYFWVSKTFSLVRDESGKPFYGISIVENIDGRKKTEEALRKSEEKYRILFENMGEGFALYELIRDPKGEPIDWRILEVNDAYTRHTGLRRDVVEGRLISEIAPGSIRHYIDRFAEVIKDQKWISFDTYAIAVDRYQHIVTFPAGGDRFANIIEDISERKKAEAAQKRSEERFRMLFYNMTEGFALHEVILDEKGKPSDYRFLEVNPAFEKETGLKRENLIGKTVLEVLPETGDFWIQNYGKVALTGEPIHFEQYAAELGRWYEVYSYRPEPDRFAVIFTDITKRKKFLQEITESEERFSALTKATSDTMYVMSPDWTLMCYLSGGEFLETAEEPLMNWIDVYIDPSDQLQVKKVIEESIRNKSVFKLEHQVRLKNGNLGWTFSRAVPILNKEGDIIEWFGVASDITYQKQTEMALKESEERYRSIFEKSQAVMLLIDPETADIVDANPSASNYYGYGRNTLKIMKISDLDVAGAPEFFKELHKEPKGEQRIFNFKHRLANGQMRDVDVYSGSFSIRGRSLMHLIVFDVTERIQAEKDLVEKHLQWA